MKEVDKFDDLPACGYPALGGRIYRSVSLKQETRARYTVNGSNEMFDGRPRAPVTRLPAFHRGLIGFRGLDIVTGFHWFEMIALASVDSYEAGEHRMPPPFAGSSPAL